MQNDRFYNKVYDIIELYLLMYYIYRWMTLMLELVMME